MPWVVNLIFVSSGVRKCNAIKRQQLRGETTEGRRKAILRSRMPFYVS